MKEYVMDDGTIVRRWEPDLLAQEQMADMLSKGEIELSDFDVQINDPIQQTFDVSLSFRQCDPVELTAEEEIKLEEFRQELRAKTQEHLATLKPHERTFDNVSPVWVDVVNKTLKDMGCFE